MSGLGEKPWRALRPDAQAFDEIRIFTVPRYKESYLSGDEWRISAHIEVYRKGKLCVEGDYRNVETAAKFLPAMLATACDDGKAYYAGEENLCDQEGCSAQATVTYRLKARYCRDGHKSEPRNNEFRKFCERHKVRGDCGFEDADKNYEDVSTSNEGHTE